ncbi:GNAT family N-acetyltransferase [Cryobacterium sp. TMT2-18-3]|uniref:GNAT family N-acetyltransferase n=1 Tax=unclassified Cryobacterium TaxID=2649013 RepID=UPI00106CAEAE|nr:MULTISPECIES: GNAT family N-acetyltransferase [unclassified Cryobacterium]TFC28292.1 GNAT family N-acetyltransferase [Cryobacterium sp. TMT2-18-2]TFC62363.1 GNAT family N-acetyltransferase [Cryobacterium sp. TMT2-18-3]
MPAEREVRVEAVASVPWEDVSLVFGTRGDPARCWCQYFKLANREFQNATSDACAGMLREQVQASAPGPGVIAYLDGEPVGWCAVEPKMAYSRLQRAKVVTEGSRQEPDDASVWAVTCFVVRVGYRRRGVAAALLRGAVAQARGGGARVVEGQPVDVALRPKAPSADLYHGTMSLFAAAGFVEVARVRKDRVVMELGV